MTIDTASPLALYTVSGTGPYALGWPYLAGSVKARVRVGQIWTDLSDLQWSASPAESTTTGAVTLTAPTATVYAGATLELRRATPLEQGFQGRAGTREVTFEQQLDQMVQADQDMAASVNRSLRVSGAPIAPAIVLDGRPLLWSTAANTFVPGPDLGIFVSPTARSFQTRSDFVIWAAIEAAAGSLVYGIQVAAAGYGYQYTSTSTAIGDLPGWEPVGTPTAVHFGADLTGVIDTVPAVSALLDYVNSLGGGLALCPAGTYNWVGSLKKIGLNNVTLMGEGRSTKWRRSGGNYDNPALRFACGSYNLVKGILLDCAGYDGGGFTLRDRYSGIVDCAVLNSPYRPYVLNGGSNTIPGIDVNGWNANDPAFTTPTFFPIGCYIENCQSYRSGGVGISMQQMKYARLKGNVLQKGFSECITADAYCDDILIESNVFTDSCRRSSTEFPDLVAGTGYITHADGGFGVISVDGSSRVKILGNTYDGVELTTATVNNRIKPGVKFQTNLGPCKGCIVSGNTFINMKTGVWLSGALNAFGACVDFSITDNSFENTGTAAGTGGTPYGDIWLDTGASSNVIAGNTKVGGILSIYGSGDANTILDLSHEGFSTRAGLVAYLAAAGTGTPQIGTVYAADGITYRYIGSGTAISDMPGCIPNGQATDDHFNGDLPALRAYLDSLANTEHGVVRGTVTHAAPVLSDADRSASLSGTTKMSNLNEPGSITIYSGQGNSKTINAATAANPAVFTITAHGFASGERVWVKDVTGGTWNTTLAGGPFIVVAVNPDALTLTYDGGGAYSGSGLGTLTGGTMRNEAAMGGWILDGSFMQDYSGLVMRTNKAVESIVTINAENNINSDDFSGSLTHFSGVQFAPQTNDVTSAQVLIANHKFATFDNCWWIKGASSTPAMILGDDRTQSLGTLLAGIAVHTVVDTSFVFSNFLLRNVENFSMRNTQFDATAYATRMGYTGLGVASGVAVDSCSFINDGGFATSTQAAIEQAPADGTSPTLPFTSGWKVANTLFRDWPIGLKLGAGFASVQANLFRGRVAGNQGIVIGEQAVAENIGHENNFMQMIVAGNQGILDLRVKDVTITGITQANPVVVTCSGGHHFNSGDRVRIDSAVGGMTQVQNKEFIAQGVTATTFQLYSVDDYGATSAAVDGTAYTAYTSGGTVKRPYAWHRQNFGGFTYSVGHGAFVVDLQTDQLGTLATGSNNVLTLSNVPTVGGFYDIRYSSTMLMGAITGRVSFGVSLAGTIMEDTQSSFLWQGPASAEAYHAWSGIIYVPPQTNTAGTQWRLNINSPGAIQTRGRVSGSLGRTRLQVRKVS